jgi:hypothetical protein
MKELSELFIEKFGEGRSDIVRWIESLEIEVYFTRTCPDGCGCCDHIEQDYERFTSVQAFADWYEPYLHHHLQIKII